jgi:hypothetical protein
LTTPQIRRLFSALLGAPVEHLAHLLLWSLGDDATKAAPAKRITDEDSQPSPTHRSRTSLPY